jgi:peptide/nickel transport system permease protein
LQAPSVRIVARAPGATWRFVRRWPVIPGIVLIMMAVFAIFPNLIAPYGPYEGKVGLAHTPPIWYPVGSRDHLLGTDHVGRDLLSRIIYGARVSLRISAVALGCGIIAGTALGLVAGYFGGLVDEFCMRLIDVWGAIPPILVGMVAAMVFGASAVTLMGVLALFAWSSAGRQVRAEALSLKTRDYVALSRVAGASTARVMLIHILPGVVNTVVVIATLLIGGLIMSEAFLSYMGAGIPSPTPAWGLMTAEGKDYLAMAWWEAFFPGVAIFLTVVSLNFIGDWTRDRLDPRLRQLM